MSQLLAHGKSRGELESDQPLLRYASGRPISARRYDHLWQRLGPHEAEYRLYRADKAHREAWLAATNSEYWTNMDWLDKYPSLKAEMHRDFVREVEADWEIGQ